MEEGKLAMVACMAMVACTTELTEQLTSHHLMGNSTELHSPAHQRQQSNIYLLPPPPPLPPVSLPIPDPISLYLPKWSFIGWSLTCVLVVWAARSVRVWLAAKEPWATKQVEARHPQRLAAMWCYAIYSETQQRRQSARTSCKEHRFTGTFDQANTNTSAWKLTWLKQ